jgi:hypothetical protein
MDFKNTAEDIWNNLPGDDWSQKTDALKTLVAALWDHRKDARPKLQRVIRTDAEIIDSAIGNTLTAIRLKQARVQFRGAPILLADVIATALSLHHPEHEAAKEYLREHDVMTREERVNRRGRPVTKLVRRSTYSQGILAELASRAAG